MSMALYNGLLPKDFWVLISHPLVSDLLKLIFSRQQNEYAFSRII